MSDRTSDYSVHKNKQWAKLLLVDYPFQNWRNYDSALFSAKEFELAPHTGLSTYHSNKHLQCLHQTQFSFFGSTAFSMMKILQLKCICRNTQVHLYMYPSTNFYKVDQPFIQNEFFNTKEHSISPTLYPKWILLHQRTFYTHIYPHPNHTYPSLSLPYLITVTPLSPLISRHLRWQPVIEKP